MTKPVGIADVDSAICIAQRRCQDLGIGVEFEAWATTAYTDGSTIHLPVVHHPVTQESLDCLYGYLIHETGHHLRPEAFDILKSAKPPEHVCALYNIVEDDGMERERAKEWRGDAKALATLNSILIAKAADQWNEAKPEQKDKQDPEPVAAMTLYQLARLDWDKLSDSATVEFIASLPTHIKELLEELLKEDWVDRMRSSVTPHDTWDIAIDLAKRLYPNNPEKEYEDIRKHGHDKEPRNITGDTIKDSQLVKGEATDAPSEGDEQESPTEEQDGLVISWKDAVLSEHNEWEEKDGVAGNIGIDWTGYKGTGVALMPTSLINVVDISKSKASDYTWNKYMPHNEEARIFANRIRRYIQAEARAKVAREKYHGRLDKQSIVKLALPPIDKGEYNKRIFYQFDKQVMKDTCILVLTDWSGSMSGPKMELAADASQRLVYVFERILKIPVALATFSNGRTQCDIGYIKPFNTRGMSQENIARSFSKFYYYSSANNDGDSVHWAWHEILKRKETRKILMVLSDGCPAGSWNGASGHETLKYVAKEIEKDGRVELYGVGICSSAVSTYYTNYKVLHNPQEINEALFNIIREGNNATTRNRD